ncbi:MAG: hypothetical protein V1723_01810 [Candidatus Uhrbacteria bacterium]
MLQPSLFYDYPGRIRRAAIAGVTLALFGIIVWRIVAVVIPPPLTVIDPSGDLATISQTIIVRGQTTPGAALRINGRTFAPDTAGLFAAELTLLPGPNIVTIEAWTKHSRTARIERRIIVHTADAPLARLNFGEQNLGGLARG